MFRDNSLHNYAVCIADTGQLQKHQLTKDGFSVPVPSVAVVPADVFIVIRSLQAITGCVTVPLFVRVFIPPIILSYDEYTVRMLMQPRWLCVLLAACMCEVPLTIGVVLILVEIVLI